MELKEIEHLAELSELKFEKDELAAFSKEFESIVELTDIIKNANVSGERKINMIELSNLREDKPKQSTGAETLLKNAPVSNKDCFVVPRVVE